MTGDPVFWIWFQLIFGFGTRRAELMMNYFKNPREIYEGAVAGNRVAGMLTEEERGSLKTAMSRAEEIKRRTLMKGVLVVTPEHEDYPELLRQIYSKPAVLYVKGDLACLRGKLAIAMVGSRKYTDYGRDAAALIGKGLGLSGAVVVSGLAHGIDTESHLAALDSGGKSIGVLGCGIDVDYPKGSARVKRMMCENGAVVTEYPLGTEPRPGNFPVRNRIISGMCHGVAVIEADLKSGSLLTARHALDQGRDIFAVPGSIFSNRSQGAHCLIREGAKLVENADDIFEEYAYMGFGKNIGETHNTVCSGATIYIEDKPAEAGHVDRPDVPAVASEAQAEPPERQEPPADLSSETRNVYGLIGVETMSVEQIAEMADMDVATILSALTELEIYGLIQGYPGRRFGIILK